MALARGKGRRDPDGFGCENHLPDDPMNRNKVVEMYCKNCKQIVPSEPTVIMQKDGGNRVEMRGPRNVHTAIQGFNGT